MPKRWKFTDNTKTLPDGTILHQIQATESFSIANGLRIKTGELGGWIEKEDNIQDNAWVYGNARVYGDALVCGNAQVYDNACVSGDARVYGDAQVYDNACVYGDALVCGNAWVYGNTQVYGNAWVYGNTQVYGNAWVYGNARVCGNARVSGDAQILTIGPIGSRNDTTTFFACNDGKIRVSCGCFTGTLDEFRQKVKETHGDNKHALVYLKAAELAELQIEIPKDWRTDDGAESDT